MKKFLAIILAGLMVFSLCACGNGETPATETPDAASPAATDDGITAFEVVEKYTKAYVAGDGATFFELSVCPQTLTRWLENGTYENKEEALAHYVEWVGEEKGKFEGDPIIDGKIDIKELSTVKYDTKEVDKVNKYLEQEKGYPANYLQGLEVVWVEISYNNKDGVRTSKDELIVSKVDGKKYVDNLSGVYNSYDIKDIIAKY